MQLNDYCEATNQVAIYPEAGTGSDLELYYLSSALRPKLAKSQVKSRS